METDTEIFNLLSLLDDPDREIQQAVLDRFRSKGKEVIPVLRRMQSTAFELPFASSDLMDLLATLEWDYALEDLQSWLNESFPDLIKGMFCIQHCLFPDLKYDDVSSRVLPLVHDIWLESTDHQTVMEKTNLFNYLFFSRQKFVPEDPFLKEEKYALLDRVLHTKHGNPVVLALLYLYLAEQTGMPVKGLVFKGGFLPVVVNDAGEILFYVNVYQQGNLFVKKQLNAFMKEYGLEMPENNAFNPSSSIQLAEIYAESLFFLYSTNSNKAMEGRMEKILSLFGDQRYLVIEEDEEE